MMLTMKSFVDKLTFYINYTINKMSEEIEPESLAIFRIMLGLLLSIDTINERGFSVADLRWGNSEDCRFPLFNSIKPFSIELMVIIYSIMFIGK